VLDRLEQALVLVAADVWVLADHFLDRHGGLSFAKWSARGWGLFRCGVSYSHRSGYVPVMDTTAIVLIFVALAL
jgi:hypothetical protein